VYGLLQGIEPKELEGGLHSLLPLPARVI
jgi:hypothetical protein